MFCKWIYIHFASFPSINETIKSCNFILKFDFVNYKLAYEINQLMKTKGTRLFLELNFSAFLASSVVLF